ncbi:MAG: DUF4910 domain-containing protein, partial [Clostridiales Family XIII bacterium]|nr:DUF4910 domain-containing protein [Clostridiales Family XIII bacterium]
MSLRETIRRIGTLIDPGRMDRCVRALNAYERYIASDGFRRAAQWVQDYLADEGIRAEIKSYPAEEGLFYETMPSPYVWECRAAWCELADDGNRRIADRASRRSSVFEGSGACPEMPEPAEFMRVDKADEHLWDGADFTGKVVFLDGIRPDDVRWIFEKRGAIGFVCVSRPVPGREDAMYWSAVVSAFWEPYFGFSVSPKEADRIRAHFAGLAKEGRKPRVRCFVDSVRHDGSFELLTALLRGETEEEILLTAHMCHPQNSCNDNLSGVSAALESFRVLDRMLKRGVLPPLKRGVRLLLVPEMLGSYAYIRERKEQGTLPQILAGVNLDMVGASQDGHNGPLTLNESPHSLPSFVGGLGKAILEELRKDAFGMTKIDCVPIFNSAIVEYHGGSDHAQWTDPLVNVPMPMLNQLPDKYYHTDADLPETLDPFILHKSGTLAASFVYTLATLSIGDLPLIMHHVSELLLNRLGKAAEAFDAGEYTPELCARMFDRYREYYGGICGSYARFFNGEERESVCRLAEEERLRLDRIAELTVARVCGLPKASRLQELAHPKYDAVPTRSFLGQGHYIADDGGQIADRIPGGSEKYGDFYGKFKERGDEGMPNPAQHQLVYY